MFVQLYISYPKAGKQNSIIDSMHRFGAAIKSQPGLKEVYTLRDEKGSCLVGLAIWDSKESMEAAGPVMAKAVERDDFEAWEEKSLNLNLAEA